jgi:hypothetical protein
MVKVIGIQFEGYNKLGDFNYMCELEEYKDTLFIFNDNEEYHNTCKKGAGNAIMRQYNKHNTELNKPKSAGIPTGTLKNCGYSELNNYVKNVVNQSVNKIKDLIKKYNYEKIYYSVGKDNKL